MKGDNDPIDVVEISQRSIDSYNPIECEIIGTLGLVDQNELDWKVVVVEKGARDQLKFKVEEIVDYLVYYFKYYKTLEGKQVNSFLKEELYSVDETKVIIKHSNKEFNSLLLNEQSKLKFYL